MIKYLTTSNGITAYHCLESIKAERDKRISGIRTNWYNGNCITSAEFNFNRSISNISDEMASAAFELLGRENTVSLSEVEDLLHEFSGAKDFYMLPSGDYFVTSNGAYRVVTDLPALVITKGACRHGDKQRFKLIHELLERGQYSAASTLIDSEPYFTMDYFETDLNKQLDQFDTYMTYVAIRLRHIDTVDAFDEVAQILTEWTSADAPLRFEQLSGEDDSIIRVRMTQKNKTEFYILQLCPIEDESMDKKYSFEYVRHNISEITLVK